MQVSNAGLALIARWEGFSPVLYNDPSPARNCTIGYGYLVHYGPCDGRPEEAPFANGITEEQGRAQLAEKVKSYAVTVEALSRPLNQNEFDALTSFCYNVGQSGYEYSSVRAAVNGGTDVCAELQRYVYAAGKVLPGLVARRKDECKLFYKEDDAMTPAEKAQLDTVTRALFDVRTQLNDLANGVDAVSVSNKWPLSLKGLWYVAGKAWPF